MKNRSLRLVMLLTVSSIALTGCFEKWKQNAANDDEATQKQERVREALNAKPEQPPITMGVATDTYAVTGLVAEEAPIPVYESEITENYEEIVSNPLHLTVKDPVSTFSVDVDTASYANARRFLNAGQMPPQDAIRVEEMVNYFDYDYAKPEGREVPFAVSTEVSETPWNENTYLLRVGVQGYDIDAAERPAANLVFLLDVSGSMDEPDKLPLLVNAFKLLSKQLTEKDRVSIVVYAGAAGVVLEPTPGDETRTIQAALDQLSAGGSTAGGEGIQLAYSLAKDSFIEGGINRVILATDGDFNVGVTDIEILKDLIERERDQGITLTTLGFGQGNYNDALMEQLADVGNGNASYIDTLSEARKVLVEELSSTLFTIAQDVKIQIEFNPNVVAEYRLIGYENRVLKEEDFKNDKVDAGDIGAGHTVTALYEIVLVGSEGALVDPHRYSGTESDLQPDPTAAEFAFLKLRYKLPGESESKLMETPLMKADLDRGGEASGDFKFAAAVAAFGQMLRGGTYLGDFTYADVIELAREGKGEDRFGYRGEFIQMVQLAAGYSS